MLDFATRQYIFNRLDEKSLISLSGTCTLFNADLKLHFKLKKLLMDLIKLYNKKFANPDDTLNKNESEMNLKINPYKNTLLKLMTASEQNKQNIESYSDFQKQLQVTRGIFETIFGKLTKAEVETTKKQPNVEDTWLAMRF